MRFGLYLHIPFCEQHCHYCAFAVSVAGRDSYQPYLQRLETELSLAALSGPPQTLYLGGGTPSLLDPDQIGHLMERLPPVDGEITIEANPGTITPEGVRAWRAHGVNRVSLGAQSFDERDLAYAGRLHSSADTVRDCELLESSGFDNINLDLIAGLPDQDRRAWLDNLDWIERLAPEHVSVYLLEMDEGARWARRPRPIEVEDEQAWFYEAAVDRLGEMGYRHYEMSNWARPGRECRHNQGYWNFVPYRGLGLAAHSFDGEARFWNTRSMPAWSARLDEGELPVEDSETRTPRLRLEEAFLLGLRQVGGFDVRRIAAELGFEYPQDWFDRVAGLTSAGLVAFDHNVLRLTRGGLLLAGGITEELLCPSLLSISEATP